MTSRSVFALAVLFSIAPFGECATEYKPSLEHVRPFSVHVFVRGVKNPGHFEAQVRSNLIDNLKTNNIPWRKSIGVREEKSPFLLVELNLTERETKVLYHFEFQVCIPSPNPYNDTKVFSVLARQAEIDLCDRDDATKEAETFLAKSLESFIGQWKHDNEPNSPRLPLKTDK